MTVIKSTAPLVPVRVFGTFEAYGRHLRLPRPYRVAIKFGHATDFRQLRERARTCPRPRIREIYQQVADEIMRAIAELKPEREPSAAFPESIDSR